MKKLLLWTILLAMATIVPDPATAGVDISVGISLPPPIVFQAAPEVIVLPDADDVYVVPDVDVDIYFWNGYWWRSWEGRWYRSRYYNRGWGYYANVPTFYFDIDPGWRVYYRNHDWYGHRWNYERIPYDRLHRNWNTWRRDRHWEKRGTWGIQDYKPRPKQERQELRRQREEEYHKRPEVQQQQQQDKKQMKQKQQDRQDLQQDKKEKKQMQQQDKQDKKQEKKQQKQQREGQPGDDKGSEDKGRN